jgi:hypothetical protein
VRLAGIVGDHEVGISLPNWGRRIVVRLDVRLKDRRGSSVDEDLSESCVAWRRALVRFARG